jgi:hypothetical protein
MAHNVPVNMWETPNSPLCVDTNETTFCTQGNINSYNDLDAFVQQHNMVMGNECFESEACPESSMFPLTTGLYGGGCDYRPNEIRYLFSPRKFPARAKGLTAKPNCRHQLQLARTAPTRLTLHCIRIKSYLST